MSLTITLWFWWLWPYLAIGAVLWLPLNYLAWRSIAPPKVSFWADTVRIARRHGVLGSLWRIAVQVVLWPIAAWETFR